MKKAAILAQSYLVLSFLLVSCGSKSKVEIDKDTASQQQPLSGVYADPLQTPCYQLTDDKPIKPLHLGLGFHGKVILKAEYDTASLEFTRYEVVMTKLLHDGSGKQYIPDEKKIAQLKPILIKHVDYIKLKSINNADCIAPVSFNFPINID
ncbi:hypothetical protein [Pontibacter liquoris]|uniref:hypothetical protein n=1 Tax=Pontibacter liquoris TaxID=2905677 RepID=UPI001FA78F8F|nr:hypothetical protein [Pontibacter liquoris]